MFKQKKEIFSIRKTALGVGSVLVGSLVFSQGVQAEKAEVTNTPLIENSVVSAQNHLETTADARETNVNSAILPKVEVITLPSVTNYVSDDTLEIGTNQVVTEAKDGSQTTTTTYKEVKVPVDTVDPSTKERMASKEYNYGTTDFYHIDESLEKPSDKIIIDQLFMDVKPITEMLLKTDTSMRDLVTNVESTDVVRNYQGIEETKTERQGLMKLTSIDGTKPTIYLETASIDPDNATFQELLRNYSFEGSTDYNRGAWTGEMTEDLRKKIYVELAKKAAENLANLAGFRYINALVGNGSSEDLAVKGYHTSLVPISQELYADAKVDYERFLVAVKKSDMPSQVGGIGFADGQMIDTRQENPIFKMGKDAYETITHRYNTSNGVTIVPVSYENTSFSEMNKKDLESLINRLPETVKENILKFIVTDDVLNLDKNTRGTLTWATSVIRSRNFKERQFDILTDTGSKKITLAVPQVYDLFDNFLHELGHAVDNRSGSVVYDYYKYQPEEGVLKKDLRARNMSTVSLRPMGRLSYSEEFIKVFEEHFLNKEDVWEYIRWTPSEAWADSFGEYLNHKFYGVDYTRYKKINGVVYSYNPALAGINPEYDAMRDTVYLTGYSPVEASEAYWEKIYQKLFEPEVRTEIVVDTVTVTEIPATNGVVRVGTKPVMKIDTVAYQTIEEKDNEQPVGYRRIKQQGQNGQVQTITTYTLVNSTSGEVISETKIVTINPVDEIIIVGSKVDEDKLPFDEGSQPEYDNQSDDRDQNGSQENQGGNTDKGQNDKQGTGQDQDNTQDKGSDKGNGQESSGDQGESKRNNDSARDSQGKGQKTLPKTGATEMASTFGVMMFLGAIGLAGKRRKRKI